MSSTTSPYLVRWKPGDFEKDVNAVEQVRSLAVTKGSTAAQLALAWLFAQRDSVVPSPGTRSTTRVEENAGAADLKSTDDDLDQIARILPSGGFGARYAGGNVPTWD